MNGRQHSWNINELTAAVKNQRSLVAVSKSLGYKNKSELVNRTIQELDLDISHWGKISWNNEQLSKAVAASTSLSEVLQFLGLFARGNGNRQIIKTRILDLKLDTSHFKFNKNNNSNDFTIKENYQEVAHRFVTGSTSKRHTIKPALMLVKTYLPLLCPIPREIPGTLEFFHWTVTCTSWLERTDF